jgi:hypothetical protein
MRGEAAPGVQGPTDTRTEARPHHAGMAIRMTPLAGAGSLALEVSANLRELLTWIARCPRTYAETMEAWRSSCPRLTVWEDALEAGLVGVARDGATGELVVHLTPRGEAALGVTAQ